VPLCCCCCCRYRARNKQYVNEISIIQCHRTASLSLYIFQDVFIYIYIFIVINCSFDYLLLKRRHADVFGRQLFKLIIIVCRNCLSLSIYIYRYTHTRMLDKYDIHCCYVGLRVRRNRNCVTALNLTLRN